MAQVTVDPPRRKSCAGRDLVVVHSNKRREAMTPNSARSLWTIFTTIVVVGFAASLVACASAGLRPVAVSDVKSVVGTWKGVVYLSGSEPDEVTLTIREDGSYDVVSRLPIGVSRGRGQITISEGRLIMRGERGHGVGRLLSSSGGDRVMSITATLSDNRTLTAELGPSR